MAVVPLVFTKTLMYHPVPPLPSLLTVRWRLSPALVLACAALAAPLAQGRDLVPIDALAEAPVPIAVQRSTAVGSELPKGVHRISREERLGVPAFVQLRPATLPSLQAQSRAAKADPASAARDQLKALADLYGLTPQDVDAAPVHHVQNLPNGASLVRLTNQRDGIEVFREQATVLLNAQSQATAIGGYLGSTTPAPRTQVARTTGSDVTAAIGRALLDWGFDATVAQQLQQTAAPIQDAPRSYQWWALPAGTVGAQGATLAQPVRAKPVWFRLPQGLVSAYYVEVLLHEDSEEHGWAYVIAADDGQLLLRHNLTAHNHAYRVFADPTSGTPHPGPQGRNGTPHPTGVPDGYAAPIGSASLLTLSSAPFSKNDPWLPATATQTQGNNVDAFANLTAPDGLNPADAAECGDNLNKDFRACTTAPGVFDHAYDATLPTRATKAQASASVVNLFYTTNWLHDWFYDVGFDEAAGNAQTDNYGRGGLGGDAMRVQALDFDGTNNANMLTPADGAAPRMRMYRFINASSVQVSGAILSAPAEGASFGPGTFDLTATVAAAIHADGCTTITNATSVAGNIALMNRGNCNFSTKVYNAQLAGATGVVIVNNTSGAPTTMGVDTSSANVTIPSIHVAQSDGAALVGTTLRMQRMQLSDRSSALDNGIIAHEWGHFISNRLIGDGSGLTSNHAKGLGEGWGDFHALLMTAAEQDTQKPGNAQWQGAYAAAAHSMARADGPAVDPANAAYYGIRRYPYSTDMAKNPLTLKHITTGVALPTTAPRNPNAAGVNAEVHNMGEVWASMLWECYAALLNTHAFSQAQDRMKSYLVTGYKLTPIKPTLIEARDALLAAIHVQNPTDLPLCAAGFAKRGAGAFAQVPDRNSATNAGVVEDTSMSGALTIDDLQLSMTSPQAQRCDADDVLDSGETGVLSITVRNTGFSHLPAGAQIDLAADLQALEFLDGATLSLPSIAANASATVTARIRLTGLTQPGSARITASLVISNQPTGFAVPRTLALQLHRDELPNRLASDDAEAAVSAMEFGSSLAAYQNAWSLKSDTTNNRFYAGEAPSAAGSHWMRTPPLQVAAAGDFTVQFQHRYYFEYDSNYYYDGGQLKISTDDGATWSPVNFAGYNGTLYADSGNPAGGQRAFVGQSTGWPIATINLGTAYAGKTVRLAWVVQTDVVTGTDGWEVDNIAFTGITNTPFPAVVADAQICLGATSLAAVTGTPQTTLTGAAFAHPLRVRLLGAGNAPLPGAVIRFAAPAAGASATLSATTALTDANGEAAVTAVANGTTGGYTITATGAGHSASFTLDNVVPVPGSCGSAQGGSLLPTAPSANLCSAGVATSVTNSNTAWAWTCVGSHTGTTASCQATRGYTVTPTAGAGGSISPSAPQTVAYQATPSFTVSAKPGYLLGTVSGCGGNLSGNTFTTAPIAGDCAVSATFTGLTLPEGPQAGQPLGLVLQAGHGWQLAQASTRTVVSLGAPALPQGVTLPHGVVSLRLEQGTQGSQATVVLTYPQALPQGARYYKYGKTRDNTTPHWYVFSGALVIGNTVTLTLRDGGEGDDDITENSVIQDPGGVGVSGGMVAPVPTLGQAALALLAMALGLLSYGRLRRRHMPR